MGREERAPRFSRALEDYLKAIYRLEEVFGLAKTTDIARELKVSPSTVSKTLKQLEQAGLVIRELYEGAKLTDKGKKLAEIILRKHRIAETFLHNFLGFDIVEAHEYAHFLEHMPLEFFDRLWKLMGEPERCPHGNPIPGALKVTVNISSEKPLTEFGNLERVRISRILCSFHRDAVLKLLALGIRPGLEACIKKRGESGLTLEWNSNNAVLSVYEARMIYALSLGKCT